MENVAIIKLNSKFYTLRSWKWFHVYFWTDVWIWIPVRILTFIIWLEFSLLSCIHSFIWNHNYESLNSKLSFSSIPIPGSLKAHRNQRSILWITSIKLTLIKRSVIRRHSAVVTQTISINNDNKDSQFMTLLLA